MSELQRDADLAALRERVAELEAEALAEPGSLREKVVRYREEREHYKESWIGEKRRADTAETKLEIAVRTLHVCANGGQYTHAIQTLSEIGALGMPPKPDPPWDKWDKFMNCFVCRSCNFPPPHTQDCKEITEASVVTTAVEHPPCNGCPVCSSGETVKVTP